VADLVGHGFGGRLGRRLLGLLALQQRVALQLGLDEGLELEVRQLQQLDRLLQLGVMTSPCPCLISSRAASAKENLSGLFLAERG
jgi:hypothetical protein